MDPKLGHIAKTFATSLSILDATEPQIRHLIETSLMDIAGVSGTKISHAAVSAKKLADQINAIRAKAIRAAFRHLRDELPGDL